MTGRVVHFELPYDDGDRARTFYRRAFGWNLQEMPELHYTGVSTGPTSDEGMPSEAGYIGGGLFPRADGPPHAPVIVVDVPSVDAALTTVEELGGKTVVAKQAVGDMGFCAYVNDSEGNLVGLWETAAG